MEINILDYLSENEIKSICEDEIRIHVRRSFKEKDLERIISNSAYYKVYGIIDDLLPNGYDKVLIDNVNEIIDNMSTFSVLRYNYDDKRPVSTASKLLEETVEKRKQDIIDKMNSVIDAKLNGDDKELYAEFQEKLSDALWNGFNIKFENNHV